MKLLISFEEFCKANTRQLIPFACDVCDTHSQAKRHLLWRHSIKLASPEKLEESKRVCSKLCQAVLLNKHTESNCPQCGKLFSRGRGERSRNKSAFCSRSCSASFNNAHKTKGCRRSKLEVYLEAELVNAFPSVRFLFNDVSAINAELDIYCPELRLAFELNGIFHFEPIYGIEKLTATQKNDKRKILACAEKGIELCVLDTMSLTYFKKQHAEKFLRIISQFISSRIV